MDTRVDRWLWSVRIFKTRSKATDACKSGKVTINGDVIKPSRMVKIGEVVDVEFPPIKRNFRIKDLAVKRVSAKIALTLVEEITPEKELEKLKMFYKDPVSVIFGYRERGSGRPTKKERRELERLKNFEKND